MSDALNVHSLQPPEVSADLGALRDALDAQIPRKQLDHNLLVATWNLRAFGSLTDRWTAGSGDSPKRDLRGLLAIKEVVSRFDVVAIQEVVGDLRSLRHLLKALGPHWSFLMTDVTRGAAGNNERLAFLYDNRRVLLSGLAAELVIPQEMLGDADAGAIREQFARTPYAVSFRSGRHTFVLVTLHVDYGKRAADRLPELATIARWMGDWARQSNRWHHDLIVLGDFNIDRHGDALWQAFTQTGLTVPEQLNAAPRSIFARHDEPQMGKYYDQIAWFEGGDARLQMPLSAAGFFDFLPHVYRGLGLSKNSVSFRISDHYPLWAEFGA